ncbi:MAG: hypothetical protein CVU11_07845 [Bacteroidetes bacterium HGW-Bacteroidetes-6]|jgi:hypothetical protein|nr:MAG: hypothetical protein CVU11_07845 [Bacteroidetes bacterium HGW-Bacteroidetes-6]
MKTFFATIALVLMTGVLFAQTNTFPASGSVGIGTTSPMLILHIKKSDTPGLKLEQDNTAGWTPQTWDIAGNEANFFIRDVTGGSLLPFRIQPTTPTSTLTLKSPGYVGIGTWSPTATLDVQGIIRIKSSATITPDSGMIKYENGDFYGFDGTQWLSFTNLDAYAQIQLLEDRIDSLEARLDSCCTPTFMNEHGEIIKAKLFQNNPNPYTERTDIAFFIPQDAGVAGIYVYDLSGKQIMKVPVETRNEGSISISAEQLQAGMYIYSLIIDGKLIDSKRMVLTD